MSRPVVITVSGSGAGTGKTRLLERLLPCLHNCAAVKARCFSPEEDAEGSRRRSKLSVLAEDSATDSPAKDTGRFLSAGARRAYLISGAPEEVRREVERIIADGGFDTVVVESNAMALALEGDLALFVSAPGEAKPGAQACRERADLVVCAVSDGRKDKRMDAERKKTVREALKQQSKENRITCRDALELAARLQVNPRLVGEVANEERIKIAACQLGCF